MRHAIAKLQQGVATVHGHRKIYAWVLGISILALGGLLWLSYQFGVKLFNWSRKLAHRPFPSTVLALYGMFFMFPAVLVVPLLQRGAKPVGRVLFAAA